MSASTNIARAAIAVLAAAALASCASLKEEGVTAGPDGGTYTVTAGTPLVVSLPLEANSDLRWELLPNKSTQLSLIGGPDYTTLPKPTVMLGLGGMTTYRFRARDAGTTTLEFVYRRPQEQGTVPARVAKFDVTVKPAVWQDLL
jgi:inhibitor of cysteine peptidase